MPMFMRRCYVGLTCALLSLAACVSSTPPDASRAVADNIPLPPTRDFANVPNMPPQRSNAEMARDFMDLTFALENGRPIDVFSRFEQPVSVQVTGPASQLALADLTRLLSRLRSEAGININQVTSGPAAITIAFLPLATLQKYVPSAACFVVPRVGSWAEYLRARRSDLDWTTVTRRERATIFIPHDTSPQEIRDCLHEELAQALGPLNDLYRLPDSVFNDDNIHTVLSGFDMLMLRTYYAPELTSGMSAAAVAQRVPEILDRLNPRGRGGGTAQRDHATGDFAREIQTALGPGASLQRRRSAASAAVNIAQTNNWRDGRLGFAWMAVGRLALGHDPAIARNAFLQASASFHANPYLRLQAAHADLHLASFALADGQPDIAIQLANQSLSPALQSQNAALLARLMMVKAEALDLIGRSSEARQVRLDSLGWARYGFGSNAEVRKRLQAIADLSPTHKSRTQ